MKVEYGKGTTKYGMGVDIHLSSNDISSAICAYLAAHDIHYSGAITMYVNGELIQDGRIYVDPSGSVVTRNGVYEGSKLPKDERDEMVGKLYVHMPSSIVCEVVSSHATWRDYVNVRPQYSIEESSIMPVRSNRLTPLGDLT